MFISRRTSSNEYDLLLEIEPHDVTVNNTATAAINLAIFISSEFEEVG